MKIYTGTGDEGTTGLFGGERVRKDDPRVERYGAVDELNACLGLARAELTGGDLDRELAAIQADLFRLGAELAAAAGAEKRLGIELIADEDARRLESTIDRVDAKLAPLKTFILPGGVRAAALLHQARAVCRRAERRVLAGSGPPVRNEVIVYLNRLGDLLFMLAREANRAAGHEEEPWSPRAEKPRSS